VLFKIVKRCIVEHGVGQQFLQPRVLALHRLQPLRLGLLKAAVLSLPIVKSRSADPVLPAHVGRLRTFAGHSSLQAAMGRYGHLFRSDYHKKAMDAIADDMFG
jgi:hypothetical protein